MGKVMIGRVFPVVTAIVCLLAIASPLGAQGKAVVRVNQESSVSGDFILLRDIARIESNDSALLNQLASIVIGRAPLPKQARVIEAEQIGLRLKQSGIAMEETILESPAKVKVIREYTEFNGETVGKLVKDFILKEMPWEKEQVNIEGLDYDETVILPRGKITYQVVPQPNEDYLGPTPISVIFKVDGKSHKRVWLNPYVKVNAAVVVSSRPMPRYHIVDNADLRVEKADLADLPSNVITDPAEAIGKRINTALTAKTPLRADMLELPPLVKKGDIVTVILESDSIRVTTLGMVKEKGSRGDTIKVMNMVSMKELYGKVVDATTVKVSLPISN